MGRVAKEVLRANTALRWEKKGHAHETIIPVDEVA